MTSSAKVSATDAGFSRAAFQDLSAGIADRRGSPVPHNVSATIAARESIHAVVQD